MNQLYSIYFTQVKIKCSYIDTSKSKETLVITNDILFLGWDKLFLESAVSFYIQKKRP
ncbi:MAG: hypothetical protein K0R18_1766 [Bacillales bacterium]|jgi:hypothetical protein|nr:hypothetical protein [Bacillales bacterium]